MVDSCALRVAPGDDDTVGALGCHRGERVGHEGSGARVGAAGEGVGGDQSGVVDAFGCDGGAAEGALEAVGGGGADDCALWVG